MCNPKKLSPYVIHKLNLKWRTTQQKYVGKYRIALTKCRLSSNELAIEKGIYLQMQKYISDSLCVVTRM